MLPFPVNPPQPINDFPPAGRKNDQRGRSDSRIILIVLIAAGLGLGSVFLFPSLFHPKETSGPRADRPAVPFRPQIAVIFDDHGYRRDDCGYFSQIPYPVAISILPELEYSKAIDRCAHAAGKEVMLHLPMEPHATAQKYPAHYIIRTDFSPEELSNNISRALLSVPHAVGVNNHMGSKATEDQLLMSLIFEKLKSYHLFFVDSRSTAGSICPQAARKQGIPFAERDVFLDNQNDRAYIEGQFEKLAAKARRQGYAVGIGHARDLTWDVTAEKLREFAGQGFEITTVKHLIETIHENSRH